MPGTPLSVPRRRVRVKVKSGKGTKELEGPFFINSKPFRENQKVFYRWDNPACHTQEGGYGCPDDIEQTISIYRRDNRPAPNTTLWGPPNPRAAWVPALSKEVMRGQESAWHIKSTMMGKEYLLVLTTTHKTKRTSTYELAFFKTANPAPTTTAP
jgi:hypothetical protein